MDLPSAVKKLHGAEPIILHREGPEANVLEFWRWALSDVVSNTARGILAEYFVACDLGVTDSIRIEWEAFDLTSRAGVRVEVKSSAYVQRWPQRKETSPSFGIAPTKLWDPVTGKYVGESKRHADVYVFCLHAHRDRATLNPLDVRQWEFLVALTAVLDARLGDQEKVGLGRLKEIGAREVAYGTIDRVIAELVGELGGDSR